MCPPDPRLPTCSTAPVLTRDASAGGLRRCPYACAMLRRAALHAGLPGHASTSVGGLSPPAPSFRPDMHGATRPRHSMPTGAPFAHPVPPDDDLVELTFRRSARSNAQPCTGLQSRHAEEIATVSRLSRLLERVVQARRLESKSS